MAVQGNGETGTAAREGQGACVRVDLGETVSLLENAYRYLMNAVVFVFINIQLDMAFPLACLNQ